MAERVPFHRFDHEEETSRGIIRSRRSHRTVLMIRLFNVFIPASVLVLLLTETALVFSCFAAGAILFFSSEAFFFLLEEGGWMAAAFMTGVVVVGFYLSDLYTDIRIPSYFQLIQQLSLVLGTAFLVQAVLSYGRLDLVMPKWQMIYATLLVLTLVPLWRTLLYWLFSSAAAAQGILLLGTSPALQRLAEAISEKPHLGIKVTGYIAEDDCAANRIEGVECSGTLPQLKEIIAARKPARLVVGVRKDVRALPLDELLELRYQGLPVESAAAVYEQTLGRVRVDELEPSTLILSSDLGPRPRSILLQSIYSFVLALVGILVLSPVMLAVAFLVRVTSNGPVLFRQKRVGLRDKVFTLYKFRSMYADAEARTGAVWATKNDSRITPLGKYLRRLRLDELPQLINVIKGDMAICGPRPERPEFVGMLAEKIPFYRQRHCVKPGITGWAQINHKYGDTVEDTVVKLEYDFYYIKHLDPALDFYIMFQTLKVMLLFRGAQ